MLKSISIVSYARHKLGQPHILRLNCRLVSTMEPFTVDGSVLEGGGQILRNSIALSAILNKPVRIMNIRAGRPKPGLRPQHLTGIQLAADLCGASLTGNAIGSTEITFSPYQIRGGQYFADTKTAGSIVLLLQVSLPIVLFCPDQVSITYKGGTDAEHAPQIDYFTQVFIPTVEKMGINMNIELRRRGFYPKGGGEVVLTSAPYSKRPLQAILLNSYSNLVNVSGNAFVTKGVSVENAHLMAEGAEKVLSESFPNVRTLISRVKLDQQEAIGPGSGIVLWAETETGSIIGGSSIYQHGVDSMQMGLKAANEITETISSKACVDQYLQDQLILFMALAEGKSSILSGQLTLHTKTAVHIVQLLTDVQFTVKSCSDTSNLIECEGLGLS